MRHSDRLQDESKIENALQTFEVLSFRRYISEELVLFRFFGFEAFSKPVLLSTETCHTEDRKETQCCPRFPDLNLLRRGYSEDDEEPDVGEEGEEGGGEEEAHVGDPPGLIVGNGNDADGCYYQNVENPYHGNLLAYLNIIEVET